VEHYLSLRSLGLRVGLRLLLLGCALLLLAASVWWDNAANRGIAPAAERTTIPFADVPQGGVNTYLLHAEVIFRPDGSVDPDNKVKRTFEMIAAAGMHWVRVQFPWEDIELERKGNFRDRRHGGDADAWAKYDYIVEQAERNGLELIVRLDRPPDWARQRFLATPEVQAALAAGRIVSGPPDNLQDFADFAATVAERYRGRLRFFQIWNEPNLPGEWNYHTQNPAELVALLRVARAQIKAVNPDAVIIFPALSPTDGRGDGVNDLDYLQGVYDAGGRGVFDIMSAQLYGLGQPPTEHRYIRPGDSPLHPIDTKTDVGRVVLLHEIMVRNGDDRTAVWVSELGWNSAPLELGAAASTWGAPVSEQQKGEYLVQAMQRAQREWPWMGAMCIWMFRWGGEPPQPNDPTPFFQLVDFAFQPLPAYEAIKSYLTSAPAVALDPAARSPLPVAATAISAALVIAAAAWLMPALAGVIALAERRSAGRSRPARQARRDPLMLAALALSLLLFYVGSPQLPITALGALLFFGLTLLRPDLALLFIPVAAPLYLAPKGVWDQRFGLARPEGYFIPLHEFVLLCTLAGTFVAALLGDQGSGVGGRAKNQRASLIERAQRWIGRHQPATLVGALLFLDVGTLGLAVADARAQALREWRWLIVEPLLFYALVRYWGRDQRLRQWLLWAWLLTGIGVAAIGLLQLTGLDLTALLPQSGCFSDRVVLAEGGLRRISSVYCHPNNLGLALGRVWPALAALALTSVNWRERRLIVPAGSRRMLIVAAGGAALCALALALSLSKGALLGAFAALLALGALLAQQRSVWARPLLILAGLGALLGLALALLGGVERLNPLGGSSDARIELWQAALRMVRDHPLTGVGLDQFYHYRTDPAFGDRYIDPAARATNEQYASHPHNLALDLLVRMGPLGIVAMAWLVLQFFLRCRRLRASGSTIEIALGVGLTAAMIAALVHGLVDNFYFVPDLAFSFWLMLGLVDTFAARRTEAQTVR
jgi:O-antigen ligase